MPKKKGFSKMQGVRILLLCSSYIPTTTAPLKWKKTFTFFYKESMHLPEKLNYTTLTKARFTRVFNDAGEEKRYQKSKGQDRVAMMF